MARFRAPVTVPALVIAFVVVVAFVGFVAPAPVLAQAQTQARSQAQRQAQTRPQSQAQAQNQGWRSLTDGKTLQGWTTVGDVKWTVVDGALSANPSTQSKEPLQGFLRSTETFGDFELTAEFFAAEDANSGLMIRCGVPAKPGSLGSCYEINIRDDHAVTPTGGIVGVQSPLPYRVKSVGKWSLFEVRAEGNHLVVKVNGETITDAHDDKYSNGAIGLQAGGPNGPGLIQFRNIKVRPLPTAGGAR